MNQALLAIAILATTVVASLSHNGTGSTGSSDCTVHAWVRAENLAPSYVSHGELRIKVVQAHCADKIASVALRLQLDEFGEVKHLRQDAVIPDIQKANNQTLPDDLMSLGYFRASDLTNEVVYDYGPYDKAMSDPEIWVVHAEERRAWSTEVTLFENNPNFSRPLVKPFIVASPAVNFPPSFNNYRPGSTLDLYQRHVYSDLEYHYIAVVNFTDGRTVDLRAGYTTFSPAFLKPSVTTTPFKWTGTFEEKEGCSKDLPQTRKTLDDRERCLPGDLRSVFVAEVTLEDGNVIQRGNPLKGRVTVRATNGSTKMSGISVSLTNIRTPHWAAERATTGGDPDFNSLLCQWSGISGQGVISVDSFSHVFKTKDEEHSFSFTDNYPSHHGVLTEAKPFMDFELQIPSTAIPDFSSYYSSTETALELSLTVAYSRDAAECIMGADAYKRYIAFEDEPTADDVSRLEDGLWDSYTPVGEQVRSNIWLRTLTLKTTVPIVVLGDISERPAEHYLALGQPSPIILASPADVMFPSAQPVIIEEPLVNTSARLMHSEGTFDPYQSRRNFHNWTRLMAYNEIPDPSAQYNQGNYAGLLWKKKLVAEERGITVTADEGAQHPFVAP
ncbi:hypothetical protein MSAN_01147000 [Mycena sanguinolenta]|uniref:Uncharacterized protein n=1 Tax=Mycena sanguinolenta TaxID=230812 RepID=A0A8H7D6H3_9AGAR|nr:hypothetical protein MSAN_01147000 [Mycena sanguinolenta]